MDRKSFLKSCGMACIGGIGLTNLLESCSSKIISGRIEADEILLPLKDFLIEKNGKKSYRNYVVLQNDKLKYPICVYRISEDVYTALLMRCSHQGNELTALGDRLHCSAHGSEFDKKGAVSNGPADTALRSFATSIQLNTLHISLKAV